MGPRGEMGGLKIGCYGYVIALSAIAFFTVILIKQAWLGWQSIKTIRDCPQVKTSGKQIRLLDTEELFAGQIGFLEPDLVLSSGLLQTLSQEHPQGFCQKP